MQTMGLESMKTGNRDYPITGDWFSLISMLPSVMYVSRRKKRLTILDLVHRCDESCGLRSNTAVEDSEELDEYNHVPARHNE
ncbi:hypothetical protein TNCV_430751 [Trichonephila clavipes]|nr:hypothetical protein TNCV_430751 [Trichonephila clavipes]